MNHHISSPARAQDSSQIHHIPIEFEEHQGRPCGSPRSTKGRAPLPDDYLNLHIRHGHLQPLLSLSLIALRLHHILCSRPGAFSTGWRGSIAELQNFYEELSGSAASWGQIKSAVEELIEAGFVATSKGRRRQTLFCIAEPPLEASARPSDQHPEAPVASRGNSSGRDEEKARLLNNVEDPMKRTSTTALPEPAAPLFEPMPTPAQAPAVAAIFPLPSSSSSSPETSQPPSSPSSSPSESSSATIIDLPSLEEGELIKRVRGRFRGQIGAATIRRLISETSFENIAKQLAWFDHRDNSWARRGPVAAFVVYCKQEAGEPEVIELKRQEEARQEVVEKTSVKESTAIIPRREPDDEIFPWLIAALSQDELERIKSKVRSFMGQVRLGEESRAFQSLLKTEVMKTGQIDALEVIPRSS